MPTAARLEVGRTVGVTERFEYVAPDGVAWDIASGSRMVLLKLERGLWRVRVRELVFNLTDGMLRKVTGEQS